MKKLIDKTFWIDAVGLLSIGLISLGYLVQYSNFAELHIRFSFLDFPIFVGELLTFFCLFLLFIKAIFSKWQFKKYYLWIIAYCAFVLIKTGLGYQYWGALACRHAALHYYFIFIIFGTVFYRQEFFNNLVVKRLLTLFVLVLLVFRLPEQYWVGTTFLIALLLATKEPNTKLKWVIFTVIILLTPYRLFFETARMMMVGHFVVGIYLGVIAISLLKIKKKFKILSVILMIPILIYMAVVLGGSHRVRSIISFNKIAEVFQYYDDQIQERVKDFEFKENSEIQLFNPNDINLLKELSKKEIWSEDRNIEIKKEINNESYRYKIATDRKRKQKIPQVYTKAKISPPIDLEEEYLLDINNGVFRLLIWRDMFEDYKLNFSIFGQHFGKPLRSISLEVMHWAEGEWGRDGWVAAHNSYFNLVYRSGIVAIILIVTFLTILLKMIVTFCRNKSITGLLLCGIIIIWFTAANFLLIFELPYSAIPLWTLYGMTFANYKNLIAQKVRKENGVV